MRHAKLALWISSFLISLPAALAQTYTITEITTQGPVTQCTDLNDLGQVVGMTYPQGTTNYRPFCWEAGQTTNLPKPAGDARVAASAIDNQRRVFGYELAIEGGRLVQKPLVWIEGQLAPVPLPFEGVFGLVFPSRFGQFAATNTLPFDAGTPGWENEQGWVDERDFDLKSNDRRIPAIWDAARRQTRVVGTLAGSWDIAPFAINDHGQLACRVSNDGWNQFEAALWDPEQGFLLLGARGRRSAEAVAINNRGQLAGTLRKTGTGDVNTDYRNVPFVWSAGRLQEIDVPGAVHAQAWDLNDQGVVVGSWTDAVGSLGIGKGAFLYRNGTVTDLNTLLPQGSGWNLTDAVKINEHGQILVAEHVGPGIIDRRWGVLTPR
ncbi:MAG: hypothetical protein RL885_22215 [Planctomycetota bacterium]